jgi:signal peptidase I
MVSGEPAVHGVGLAKVISDKLVGINLDHRGRGLDGRFFGLVAQSEIYGKALGIYSRRDEGFVWRPL